jgi:hypothetical protein
MRHRCIVAASVIIATTAAAQAAITGGTGSTSVIPAPASVARHALESNTQVWAFDEVQNFVLPVDLIVDITAVGLVDASGDLTPGVIPAGTVVSSHFLHSDPETETASTYEGTVTFDRIIVGIIVNREPIALTDGLLGNPATTYTDSTSRGLELGNDRVRLNVGRFSINYRFVTSGSTDDIRVITVVPGASTAAGAAMAGLCVLRRRRR